MIKLEHNEFVCKKSFAKKIRPMALFGIASLMVGCSSAPPQVIVQAPQPMQSAPSPVRSSPAPEIKITAIGYGASSSYETYTPGQKKLMAMRASKLDAYRSLAEQVQGVRVNGNSTVSAMMSQVDGFRVFVDAYLRGAQVITVTPMGDGNYETTLELTLDSRFFNSVPQQGRGTSEPVVVGSNIKGAVGTGAAYGTNFYYTE
ncbi:MAG: LPP20 family lipoprotein [Gallionella sp.]|jgi:hypothetical protein|nr:LPP20 family lipoprotein [Gallionella sp.]